MQYALLIYEHPGSYEDITGAERDAVSGEYAEIARDPRVVGGARLRPVETATTVRVEDRRMLSTDGPFADTKEVFGGFYLVDVDGLDAARDIAAQIPAARLGGAVEIRELVEPPR